MNQTAEVIELTHDNQFKPVEFDITPEAITEMVKKYESLELIPGDKESYQTIRKAKMICTKARTGTDRHRKELGSDAREWIKNVNSKAQELIAPLLPLEEKLKNMLKEEDQREEKIEQVRLEKINKYFGLLESIAKAGLQYNRASQEIAEDLGRLETFNISVIDFGERFEEAERVKADGIIETRTAFRNREGWESEQIAVAKMKKEQEAESKRLADERAELEKIQSLADKAKELADQEALKIRKANEKLESDRKALESEIKAQEESAALKEYYLEWDEANLINLGIIQTRAIEYNKEISEVLASQKLEDEKDRIEHLKKDKERTKLVFKDKKILVDIANNLDGYVSTLEYKRLKTKSAVDLVLGFVESLKEAVYSLEESAKDMI